ncbi:MAG: hypothetical protein JWM18_5059, partial [Chloroflexi bacterium]|nr:hypothetical protein [Chloroflexota bacterium]
RLAGAVRAAAAGGPAPPLPPDGMETLREAHDALGRQLLAERRALQAELDGALRGSREEADRLRSELAAARAANEQIVGSRTWRYTQPVRDTLARVRERR